MTTQRRWMTAILEESAELDLVMPWSKPRRDASERVNYPAPSPRFAKEKTAAAPEEGAQA